MSALSQNIPSLTKINFKDLAGTINQKSAASLEAIIENPDVSHLVVFESEDKKRRRIFPAGKGQRFASPSDAAGHQFDGMQASAYVDLKEGRGLKMKGADLTERTEKIGAAKDDERVLKLQQKIAQYESDIRRLEDRFARARNRMSEQKNLIDELQAQLSEKRHQSDQLSEVEHGQSSSNETNQRHQDLEKAEENLIAQMNDYMVKEAELEQREEEINSRERELFRSAG